MIRAFGLQDIFLIRKLQDNSIPLDLERSVLRPRAPLWVALTSQMPFLSSSSVTYVLRNKGHAGFVQAQQGRGPAEFYLTFLAPPLDGNDLTSGIWSQLLDTISLNLGQRGVQRVFSKLPVAAKAEAAIFREANFRVYTREQVFRLPQPTLNGVSAGPIRLRPWESKDAWGVHRLYCMSAPRFVQQAEYLQGEIGETATSDWAHAKHEERHVWIQSGEVVAYIRLLSGERGHWIHLLMHSDHIEHADALINLGITRLRNYGMRPVYCAVRTYETNLTWALKAAGFREYQTRFLLVKQIAVPVRQPAFEALPHVEAAETAPTASVGMGYSNNKREEPTPICTEVLRESQ